MDNLSISEQIVLLKDRLNDLICSSGLTIDIVWLILQDYLHQIEHLKNQYINEIILNLNKKNEKMEDDDNNE